MSLVSGLCLYVLHSVRIVDFPVDVADKHDRVELPENLNSLFRPVSMLTPDNEIICAVILYSEGFLNGPALSRKIIQFYSLCKDQLSNQPHYGKSYIQMLMNKMSCPALPCPALPYPG